MRKVNYNKEDLLGHHAVAAVIKDRAGGVLMQKHLKYGFWTIPVGKVKKGQNVEEGLKEEIKEECNLSVKKSRQIKFRRYNYIRDGKRVIVLAHLFEVLSYTGTMRNREPQKHGEQRFLPLARIKRLPYISDMTLLYLSALGYKRKARLTRK